MEITLSMFFLGLFIIFLIYLSGWFSSTETAITNLSVVDMTLLKNEKNYHYLLKLRNELDKSVVSILVVNN